MKTRNTSPIVSRHKMKAIVQFEYGSPDVLSLADVDKPVIKENEVLVRVHGASVNSGDWHLMRGTPFIIRLIFGGLLKPKSPILGSDIAGIVESVGSAVTQFQPGDEVFGELSGCGFGAFAEYVAAPETQIERKPTNLTFAEAATIPIAALSALQALRDFGNVQPGQKVLINGASGGVGSFAVQIAKAYGAEVSAVCSTTKVDMVKSLGADHIIDYTQTDPTQIDASQTEQPYDLILDVAAYRSVFDFLPALTPAGTYVMIGGATARFFQVMFLAPWIAKTSSRTVKCLEQKNIQADLVILRALIESGQLSPHVDRCYGLSEVPDAIRHIEQRQVKGKVAIAL